MSDALLYMLYFLPQYIYNLNSTEFHKGIKRWVIVFLTLIKCVCVCKKIRLHGISVLSTSIKTSMGL